MTQPVEYTYHSRLFSDWAMPDHVTISCSSSVVSPSDSVC